MAEEGEERRVRRGREARVKGRGGGGAWIGRRPPSGRDSQRAQKRKEKRGLTHFARRRVGPLGDGSAGSVRRRLVERRRTCADWHALGGVFPKGVGLPLTSGPKEKRRRGRSELESQSDPTSTPNHLPGIFLFSLSFFSNFVTRTPSRAPHTHRVTHWGAAIEFQEGCRDTGGTQGSLFN